MLQNVASDNKKIARRVVGDSACVVASEGGIFVFKAVELYPLPVHVACRIWVKVKKFTVCGLALPL
jgi:hypothetical protein